MKKEILCLDCTGKLKKLVEKGIVSDITGNVEPALGLSERWILKEGSLSVECKCDDCGKKLPLNSLVSAVSMWFITRGYQYQEWESEYLTKINNELRFQGN
jgi:hypothetical protein